MSILYHYTSQHGLLGILNSKSVWATNTHFLNDPTEFVHGLSFAASIASYFFDSDYWSSFGSALHRHLKSIRGDDLYVSSFSEKPDLLSQWRGYCPSGSGYCIGLDRAAMAEYCEERELQLEPCLYGHDEQRLKVTEIVTSCMALYPTIPLDIQLFNALDIKAKAEYMEEFNERLSGDLKMRADLALDAIGESLLEVAPLFKHEGFHEEAEWRIVTNHPVETVEFRPGPSYVIPYVCLDLLKAKPKALKRVIVGPNPNQQRALRAAEFLVKQYGHDPKIVTTSAIPFNYW
ncbi:DUF2971 domain-containing protein [Pseudomonas sp. PDM32]|uniref:DUF2971 domain-containing protein n=1 Tax=Pseudomonas sp. PDM32 TaxID=2854768 RepID=UPI001C46FDF6|nr:DUF2971 domain-containing protein [Pseudomonas sp. PDM32]MBV7573556.1 DUF2971 domain-containing protein [Pseudomonas sp. PDM32]